MSNEYSTIRDLLGSLIGKELVEITQHDEVDWLAGDPAFFVLHFGDGSLLRVVVVEDDRILLTPPRKLGDPA